MSRRYEGPEHESLRAVARCLMVHFGDNGIACTYNAIRYFGVESASELSPFGANYVRKLLEKSLPLRGDYL